MNEASELLVWGIVVHLICDWPLQNDWMANNKAKRAGIYRNTRWYRWSLLRHGGQADKGSSITVERDFWWLRHPAAYVHSGIHLAGMLLVFPVWAAVVIATTHLLIDTRVPVAWWSKLVRQTQPGSGPVAVYTAEPLVFDHRPLPESRKTDDPTEGLSGHDLLTFKSDTWLGAYDIGTEVRFWTDQVFHIAVVAAVALLAA